MKRKFFSFITASIILMSCASTNQQITATLSAESYFARGLQLFDAGEYESGIMDFTQVIRLDPNNADAFLNRGVGHERMGNYAQAISDATQAIRLNSSDAFAFGNRGNAHLKMGNYTLARADFQTVLQLRPNATWAKDALSMIAGR